MSKQIIDGIILFVGMFGGISVVALILGWITGYRKAEDLKKPKRWL